MELSGHYSKEMHRQHIWRFHHLLWCHRIHSISLVVANILESIWNPRSHQCIYIISPYWYWCR